jgi:hypothetical protein
MLDLPVGKSGPKPALPARDEPPPADDGERPALHAHRGQEELFTIRRGWTPVLARLRGTPFKELPRTAAAQRLVQEFSHQRPQSQTGYTKNIRTLVYLVHWLGAETAFFERDIYDLAELDVNLAAASVCKFLGDRGMLVEDPDLHEGVDPVWIETTLAALPEPVASEVATWVRVLCGQGRRASEARGHDGIRRYLSTLQPHLPR